ncbi:toxin-antitoxin system YwqK family antitoxin [Mongoliibacter ruber]|uniref:Antitoxin component YwqK of YwqJK toxin-antitoxin module n=1 Tax=Mongoliibacter ruber TaxID=1750599 RepID=A0A2T0WCF9_9BACT|nr:toxin-antitoxin system YwqK family antitoxin [Mongoliibacter ruber]PRY84391.1 antitoxin component YwqK of YwqJK toxin-antitoxin module [Mongoliibacter ruber]
MKNLLLIIACFFAFSLAAQQPENGFVRMYHGTNKLIAEGNLIDGEKVGKWKVYLRKNIDNPFFKEEQTSELASERDFLKNFFTHPPIQVITYRDGELHGPYESFYLNGKLEVITGFKNGKLEGEYQEFSEFGKPLKTGRFIDGKMHRVWRSYYLNGKLKGEENYFLGLRIGEWKKYHPNGQLEEFITYVQHKPAGEYLLYHANGKTKISGKFEDGLQKGEWKEFFENGNLATVGNFDRGLEEGMWEVYDEEGRILTLGSYEDGIKVGAWTEQSDIHPDILRRGHYDSHQKTGSWKLITKSGEVLQEEIYDSGRLVAFSPFRSLKGEILEAGNFENGEGSRVYYDPLGHKIAWGQLQDGKYQGVWQYFHPRSEQVAKVGRFHQGLEEGEWKYFTIKGNLSKEESFINGMLVHEEYDEEGSPGMLGPTDLFPNANSDTALRQHGMQLFRPDAWHRFQGASKGLH